MLKSARAEWSREWLTRAEQERLDAVGLNVCRVRLNVADEDVARAANVLSDDELERASRFRFERDRRRFVVARSALRELLADKLDVTPASIQFDYGAAGKPSLRGRGIRFNVSHSDELAMMAFCDECEVGVDIERAQPVSEAATIARWLFGDDAERATWAQLEGAAQTLAFYIQWTRTEAWSKAIGLGLGALEQLRTLPRPRFEMNLTPEIGFVGALALV